MSIAWAVAGEPGRWWAVSWFRAGRVAQKR